MKLLAHFGSDSITIDHHSNDIKKVIEDYAVVMYDNNFYEWVIYNHGDDVHDYEATFALTHNTPAYQLAIPHFTKPTQSDTIKLEEKYDCICGGGSVKDHGHVEYCIDFNKGV